MNGVTIKSQDEKTYTAAGYGVVWGGKDLEGEYFMPDTDFWFDRITSTPMVLYHHGQDGGVQKSVLGQVQKTAVDEIGLWIEAQIDRAQEYAEAVRELVSQGVLGWSSGAVGHLVERAPDGKLISWPIVEFSLTPTPAEPRTLGVQELRELAKSAPPIKALLPEDSTREGLSATAGGGTESKIESKQKLRYVEEGTMSETIDGKTIEELQSSLQGSIRGELDSLKSEILDSILAALAESPALKDAGYVAPDSETDRGGSKTFGDFLLAVRNRNARRLREVYKTKALTEGADVAGGYLVPEQFVTQLLEVATEGAVVEPRAFQLPLTSMTAKIPTLDPTGTTPGQSHFLGGVVATWTDEAGVLTETEPVFSQIELTAHKLSGYTLASSELTADSAVALEALLTRLFGLAIGWHRDYAFLQGDGTAKPLGVINSAATVQVSRDTAGEFKLADAAAMLSKLLASSFGSAVWVMHQTLIPQLVQMVDAGNNSIWVGNVQGSPEWRLFGLPIVFSEKVTTLGTAGDVMLCDFNYYIVANRGGISIASSEHYRFVNDQMTWRFVDRVDGRPWLTSSLRLADGTTTVSPFVLLA